MRYKDRHHPSLEGDDKLFFVGFGIMAFVYVIFLTLLGWGIYEAVMW